MADQEIERFTIVIDSNIEVLIKGVKSGADAVENELKDIEKTGTKALKETGKQAQGLGGVLNQLKAVVTDFIGLFAFDQVKNFFMGIGQAVVGANAQFETYTTQFQTLLGSTDAAKARMEDLAKFAVETPFELPQVVEASRTLEVFGGKTLATGDNLRIIGDIAAGVNQPFQDVAFWIGRMYDAMKSGRPFGEAAARLQEMGAMSGKTRAQLEQMTKSGASGEEMWAKFSETVGAKFTGNMVRLSKTFQGIMSNLNDFQANLMRVGGEPLFETIKGDAEKLLSILSEPAMQDAAQNLAKALGEAAAQLTEIATGPFLEGLDQIDPSQVNELAEALRRAATAVSELLDLPISADLGDLVDTLTILINTVTTVVNLVNGWNDSLSKVSPVFDYIREAIIGALNPLASFIEGMGYLNDQFKKATGASLVEVTDKLALSTGKTRDEINELTREQLRMASGQVKAQAAIEDTSGAIEDQADKLSEAEKAVSKYATELLDMVEQNNQAMADLESSHQEKVAEIQKEYNAKIAEAGKERTKAIAEAETERTKALAQAEKERAKAISDLEKELAQKRKDIVDNARKELAKLEADTDRQLKEQETTFNREELRRTQDHLSEMRQLRQQYLNDIEDAVKNRDARALVDARRQYEQEKQQAEEKFNTDDQRNREDQDLRLQQIREEEQLRAEEIMAAQEQELLQLQDYERQKRKEIAISYGEQVAQAQAAYTEQVAQAQVAYDEQIAKADEFFATENAKEQENYAKRKAELNKAVADRLETIAKGLADEDKINADEAKKILETLATYFGEGGEIDKLMESFIKRRAQRIEIEVAFNGTGAGSSPSSSAGGGGGSSGAMSTGSGNTMQIPSFQHGGSMVATRPTLAQFGEVPEMVQFTPLSKMGNIGGSPQRMEIDLKMSGSAPPGIRSADRDEIAMVLLNAFTEAGFDRAGKGRGQ